MSELVRMGLLLLNGLLELCNNWLTTKEQQHHETRVADIRADPATEWLRKFGGSKDKRTSPGSADTGSGDNQ